MHPNTQGFLLTLIAVLAWGTQLPIAKGAFSYLDPATVNVIRFGVASLALMPFILWQSGWPTLKAGLSHPLIWLAGGIGMAGSSSLVYLGLYFIRPEIAVLVIAMQPTITAMVEWLLYRRPPGRITLACMVTAFLGVSWAVTRGGALLLEPTTAQVRSELMGLAFVLTGASCWVLYTLVCAHLRQWPALTLTALTTTTSVPTLLVVWVGVLCLGLNQPMTANNLQPALWHLVYLAFIGVLAAMFLWNMGTQRIGSLNAMLMLNLMPVVTFVYRTIEGAPLLWSEIVGAALVVLALMTNNLWIRHQLSPPKPMQPR